MDTWSCYDYAEDSDGEADARPSLATPALGDVLIKRRTIGRGAQGALYEAVLKDDPTETPTIKHVNVSFVAKEETDCKASYHSSDINTGKLVDQMMKSSKISDVTKLAVSRAIVSETPPEPV